MEKLPTVTHSGELTLFGVTISVHHLDNEQRVIEQDDVTKLFEAMSEPDAPQSTQADLEKAAAILTGRA